MTATNDPPIVDEKRAVPAFEDMREIAYAEARGTRPLRAPEVVTCMECEGRGMVENATDLALVARGLPREDVAVDECGTCTGYGKVLVGCPLCEGGMTGGVYSRVLCFWCDARSQGPAYPDEFAPWPRPRVAASGRPTEEADHAE